MRHRFPCVKMLLVVSLGTVFVLTGSAQSDWIPKLRELRDKGNPVAQLEFIEKTFPQASSSEKPLLLMQKALVLEGQAKSAEALASYEEVLKNPGSMAEYAHLFAARLCVTLGRDDKAREHLNAILELSPNLQLQNEAKFELARLALKDGHPAEARALLVALEKKQRSDTVYGDILWELALAERKLGNQASFCRWIKKIFIQHPESPNLAGWSSELAGQAFEGKPVGCSMDLDDRKKRIKNLQWAGLSKKAWDEIESLKAMKGQDSFDSTMLEALYHLHEGEVSEALALLLPYYEKKKSDFNYMTTLATAAARAGESQLAVGSYYTAYKSSPRSKLGKQALYQAAFLSYQFQDYDGAARRFQEFMKVYSNSGLAKDARWHLAWIRYLRGDYEGSYRDLAELKKSNTKKSRRGPPPGGNDRIAYWMAMSLFRQGQYAEAKAAFESIAKDGGQSYYAMASRQRLKKVEALLPKPQRPVLSEQTRRLSRFSASEFMVSMDDFEGTQLLAAPVSDDVESEETMVLNPLSSASELAGEGAPAGDDEAVATTADAAPNTETAPAPEESKNTVTNPMLVKRFERARDLMILGLNDWAKWDLYDVERRTANKDYLKTLMNEYETIEQYHRSSSIAANAFAGVRAQYGIDGIRHVWQHAYPQAYRGQVGKWSNEFQVPTELIWGIMRAESSYKRDVVSPVGAIGLMQIMPNTGNKISGLLLKEKNFTPQLLFEPDVSIRLGTKYLQRLLRQFDQNAALMAASYNAGPHRVRGWLASFGQLDMDEFIEHIPFLETRNYVKRVLSNAWVYNQLYGNKKDFFPLLAEPLKIRFQTMAPSKETWEDI